MQIIRTILESSYFTDQPPVLIDIGASGELNPKWKLIAPYSVCIAFDADDREFHVTEQSNKAYRKLVTFNRIVTSQPVESADFYLTSSPFCSSLLRPMMNDLQPWMFSNLFTVEKQIKLSAITIEQALRKVNINHIDWFKSDTQGTDLRLFSSLPQNLSSTILAAEFEPGILDAYEGEDKLYSVMREMHNSNFWLSRMDVKGIQRLESRYARQFGQASVKRTIRKSPGWAEVTYLRQPKSGSVRDWLLLYVFALIEQQYGYALEIIDAATASHQDALFEKCKVAVVRKINQERWKIPVVIFKRQFNKLLSSIND